MYTWQKDQVTYIKFGHRYFAHTDQKTGFKSDNEKDVSVWGALGRLRDLFYCQILNQTFWSVCTTYFGPNLVSVTWSAMCTYFLGWFIIFYTIRFKFGHLTHNKIDLLQEFNCVLGFSIQTDPTFNSNSFAKSFQHLTSRKIVLCLQWIGEVQCQNF
jgi:hypothetical protein